jgi:hypothetical protein
MILHGNTMGDIEHLHIGNIPHSDRRSLGEDGWQHFPAKPFEIIQTAD